VWRPWRRGEVFTEYGLGGPKGRDHWKDLGVCGGITLRWTFGRQGSMGIRLAQNMYDGEGFCEYGIELSGFIKKERLLFDKLSDYQLFKEYPAPWRK
jgi:hypothetical protein